MARNVPERIKTKGGHSPRARIHAAWSPIGQKMRRTTMLRGLAAVVAVMFVIGLAADAYAQSFFDSLPSIQGLGSAAFAGDTLITDNTGKIVLADVGNQGDHRLAVKLKDISPVAIEATVAIEDRGFYTNPGFDLPGIIRAAFDNIRAGHIVGGGKARLSRADQLLPRSAFRRLRARRAAPAWLSARRPAAQREDHPGLGEAADGPAGGQHQPRPEPLSRSQRPTLLRTHRDSAD